MERDVTCSVAAKSGVTRIRGNSRELITKQALQWRTLKYACTLDYF